MCQNCYWRYRHRFSLIGATEKGGASRIETRIELEYHFRTEEQLAEGATPTDSLPGTDDKMAAMARRAAAGQPIFVKGDAQPEE